MLLLDAPSVFDPLLVLATFRVIGSVSSSRITTASSRPLRLPADLRGVRRGGTSEVLTFLGDFTAAAFFPTEETRVFEDESDIDATIGEVSRIFEDVLAVAEDFLTSADDREAMELLRCEAPPVDLRDFLTRGDAERLAAISKTRIYATFSLSYVTTKYTCKKHFIRKWPQNFRSLMRSFTRRIK